MELGERLKQARLEAGLSQRQLCGERISRNMLSQIENGSARPSMDTLRYLAERLEKPVSYFLEEDVLTSPNQSIMSEARAAWNDGRWEQVLQLLKDFRDPDEALGEERDLLQHLALLMQAEDAVCRGKPIYGVQLLTQMGKIERGYCAAELEKRRLLLLARAEPEKAASVCGELPSLDEELLLRARAALQLGKPERCEQLLLAAEDHEDPQWNYIRAESLFAREKYEAAAQCYHMAEALFPGQTASRLEHCYREMGDFKQAYFYACKQR